MKTSSFYSWLEMSAVVTAVDAKYARRVVFCRRVRIKLRESTWRQTTNTRLVVSSACLPRARKRDAPVCPFAARDTTTKHNASAIRTAAASQNSVDARGTSRRKRHANPNQEARARPVQDKSSCEERVQTTLSTSHMEGLHRHPGAVNLHTGDRVEKKTNRGRVVLVF